VACAAVALTLTGCSKNETPGGAPAVAAPDPRGEWQTRPSMRHARAAHAVVGTSTAIYALAGTGEGGKPVLPVERFDGTAWAEETTLPGDGLNAPAAAVVGDTIYLVGGFNTTTNVPTAGVLTYNCTTQKWGEAAPLPAPRGGHAAVVLNGKVHVFGGGNSRSTIADHSAYDPMTNTWTNLAPLPRAMGSPAAVVVAGKVYSIGGRSGTSDFGDVHVYDPATNAWLAGPAIEPRGTAGAVLYRGAVYLFGGESQAKKVSLAGVLRLDPARGAWEEATPMPTARNFARAVLFEDSVYVVGGSPTAGLSHSSAGSAVVERFYLGGAG
jgi:N-acetylneuraminic acid mutarotase